MTRIWAATMVTSIDDPDACARLQPIAAIHGVPNGTVR